MFKVGDKVRCIDNCGVKEHLELGKEYIINRNQYAFNEYVNVEYSNKANDFLACRFELVKSIDTHYGFEVSNV
jgi:hypothetical protein